MADPRTLKIRNATRQVHLATQARLADTFGGRLKGLLGTRGLPEGAGLILDPCNSVHMFFMSYPIDVLFLSGDGRVVGIVHRLQPWRLTPIFWKARRAVELPAGVIEATGTCEGDSIVVEAEG